VTTAVTLITKADCSLCDQAKVVLERLSAEYDLRVEAVNLDTEEGHDLATRAGMAFPPGVLVDGEPFSYGRLSERKLRRHLDRTAPRASP
jgi:thiol-disulfide isomerase/thioredoxin